MSLDIWMLCLHNRTKPFLQLHYDFHMHGLRTPREEMTFTARPKIKSQSQILGTAEAYFCLPHRPNFSDFFYLCRHWVSVVRVHMYSSDLTEILEIS